MTSDVQYCRRPFTVSLSAFSQRLSLFFFKYLNFALVLSFTTPFYLGCLMTVLFLNNQLMVSIYCNCLTFNYTRFAYQRHSSCYDVAHNFTYSVYRCFYSDLTFRKKCTLMALAYHIALHERQFSLHNPPKCIEAIT